MKDILKGFGTYRDDDESMIGGGTDPNAAVPEVELEEDGSAIVHDDDDDHLQIQPEDGAGAALDGDGNAIPVDKLDDWAAKNGYVKKEPEGAKPVHEEVKTPPKVGNYRQRAMAEAKGFEMDLDEPETVEWIENRAFDIAIEAKADSQRRASFESEIRASRPQTEKILLDAVAREFPQMDQELASEIVKSQVDIMMGIGPGAFDFGQYETDPAIAKSKSDTAIGIARNAYYSAMGMAYEKRLKSGAASAASSTEEEEPPPSRVAPQPVTSRPPQVTGAIPTDLSKEDQQYVRDYAAKHNGGKVTPALVKSLIEDGDIIPFAIGAGGRR